MIQLKHIYQLNEITDEEKANLIEKFIACQSQTNITSFIKDRAEIWRMIENYRSSSLKERQHYQEIRTHLDTCTETTVSLEKQILELDLPDLYKKVLYDKYKQLTSISSSSDSHSKLKEWIENVIKIPFQKLHRIGDGQHVRQYLAHVRKVLDQKLYGMVEAKEQLLGILNNKLLNPDAFKSTLALVGSPGTGKTALVLAFCEALELPCYQISLGGKHDPSFFMGHSYTYEGSRPGQLVVAQQQMGCKNGIIFFDEFDKIDRKESQNISNLLLHVTDFTQNHKFFDEYLAEIPIDLSREWFIFSLNEIDDVNPILRNRMTFINVPGYTKDDKESIVRNYLLPKLNQRYGFSSQEIIFGSEIIRYLIDTSPDEDGVREIDSRLTQIYNKINLLKTIHSQDPSQQSDPTDPLTVSYDFPEFKLPLNLTANQIDLLLTSSDTKDDQHGKPSDSYNMMYL